jgi:hypothetical protein
LLGRWVSDLQVGDHLGPMDHAVTPFLLREYAHAVESSSELHQGGRDGTVIPPTIVHGHKTRLLAQACPAGAGQSARVHLIYDATYHRAIPSPGVLAIAGEVTERDSHKGRERLVIEITVRDKQSGVVYTTYRDTSLLSFRSEA